MRYFGYGSNLNEKDLKKWCDRKRRNVPKLLNPKIEKLENYAIGFTLRSISRGGGVADIIASEGDYCWGVVFDVTDEDLEIIDMKEGVKPDGTGAYKRLSLPDNMMTYVVVKKESDFVQPTNEYLDAIIEGAKNYGLPKEWIDKLESFKTKII